MFEEPQQITAAVTWLTEKKLAVVFQPSANFGECWAGWLFDEEIRSFTLVGLVAKMRKQWRPTEDEVKRIRKWRNERRAKARREKGGCLCR